MTTDVIYLGERQKNYNQEKKIHRQLNPEIRRQLFALIQFLGHVFE